MEIGNRVSQSCLSLSHTEGRKSVVRRTGELSHQGKPTGALITEG